MSKNSKIKISSNRNFGLVFFVFFLIVSFWPLLNGNDIRIWSLIVSFIFFILGILNSSLLTPLNLLWFKFGLLLGSIIAPIVMALIFFIVVTPIGVLLKIFKKDLLNLKYSKHKETYWLDRDKPVGTMKRQF